MSVFIIGAGMGDTKTLTREAMEKIEEADVIIGAKRIAEPFSDMGKQVFFEYDADKIADILKGIEYESATVLFSGDASFYSGAKRLAELFPQARVCAGISSVSYFCAKIGISADGMNIVSMHGRKCNIVSEVRSHKRTFALLGENPCARLTEYGFGDAKVYVGERLSYSDEKILSGKASDFANAELDKLSVIVIENSDYDNGVKIGMSDDEFIRGSAPMTKSEVRAVSVSRLDIAEDDVCWDIGAGTGSVTVEMALLCGRGMVYAVEKNADAAELIRKNCHKFKTDNVEIITAEAPDCLCEIAAPDKVFIGGSSGNLRGIIKAVAAKNKNARLVINAVSLETVAEAVAVVKDMGMDYEISQISVSRANRAGTLNIMRGMNPVYIISARLR